jgi:hypothetical protein
MNACMQHMLLDPLTGKMDVPFGKIMHAEQNKVPRVYCSLSLSLSLTLSLPLSLSLYIYIYISLSLDYSDYFTLRYL